MSGVIRTREACPVCGGKFLEIKIGKTLTLACPTHNARPNRVYIYWWDATLDKPRIITKYYKTGKRFTDYGIANGVLEAIRTEKDYCENTGKRFDITKFIQSETEELKGKFLFQIEDPGIDKITWLSDVRSRRPAKSYLRKLEQYCNDHFIPKFGDKIMTEAETLDIAKFKKYLVEEYRMARGAHKGHPLSDKSVKNVMDQLRGFCNWLNKMKRDFVLPIFDPISVPEKIVRVMPLEDRTKAFNAIKSHRIKAIIDFLIKHPVRPSEACAMDVRHFDLQARTVWMEQALDCDRTVKTRKNKKEYILPLHPDFDTAYIKGRFGREIAFPNKLGTRYTAWTLNEAWKTACRLAKVPYVNHYNATKHTTMTQYSLDGHSEKDMELMAGQSTSGMSKKYVKRSVEMLRKMHSGSVSEIKKEAK